MLITYMYWNNPIVKMSTLIQPSLNHQLFYHDRVPLCQIQPQQTLSQLCDLANQQLSGQTVKDCDLLANIVKVNQMVASIQKFGCVKPLLLHYCGAMPMPTGTGDSRLKAIECIPEITHVPAIVSTHARYSYLFDQYQKINSLVQLKKVCGTDADFYVRYTNESADYGVDWIEYNVDNMAVPNINWCITVLQNYIGTQSRSFKFTTSWFTSLIDWESYLK